MGAWDFLIKSNGNGKKPFHVLVVYCVHRNIDAEAFDSSLALQQLAFQCQSPRITIRQKSGDALIDRSRSIVATRFMENANFDLLFFIDDDLIFNPLDVIKISKLCHEKNLGIVGGPYVKKTMQRTHYAIKTFDGYEYKFGDGGSCEEVEQVSTGFMAIQKRVFEKMVKELPKDEMMFCTHGGLNFYPFFQPYPTITENQDQVYLSEDWAAVERWKRLGGKVYCDTTTRLGHAGKYIYTDNDMLRPPKPNFDSFKYLDDNGDLKVEGIEKEVKAA